MKNTMMIDGRIGASGAEVRQTRSGKRYLKFSIANNSMPNQEKADWYDVICYDAGIIDNLAEYLTKGTYVMVIGNFKADVNVDRNGKVWLNQTITAYSIQFIGTKDRENSNSNSNTVSEGVMSTYTGGTMSSTSIPKPPTATVEAPVAAPAPEPVPVSVSVSGGYDDDDAAIDDDLPF